MICRCWLILVIDQVIYKHITIHRTLCIIWVSMDDEKISYCVVAQINTKMSYGQVFQYSQLSYHDWNSNLHTIFSNVSSILIWFGISLFRILSATYNKNKTRNVYFGYFGYAWLVTYSIRNFAQTQVIIIATQQQQRQLMLWNQFCWWWW